MNFVAPLGKVSVLLGSSGIGKTTLFKLISGLLSPAQGKIVLKNKDNKEIPLKDNFTYMQQNDLLLPWRDVFQNLLLNFELNKTSLDKKNYVRKVDALLEKMCLLEYKFALPHELSGGMRQRISLARAMLQDKFLLLLDEPFSSSDVIIREDLYYEIKKFILENERVLLVITHDFRDALALADYIFVISNYSLVQINLEKSAYSLSNEQKNSLEQKIKTYLTMNKRS